MAELAYLKQAQPEQYWALIQDDAGGAGQGRGRRSCRAFLPLLCMPRAPRCFVPHLVFPLVVPRPGAALTQHLSGTDLGPLGQYFNQDTDPGVLRCVAPEAAPYAWDISGERHAALPLLDVTTLAAALQRLSAGSLHPA